MASVYEELVAYMQNKPVINTHCHHLENKEFANFDLDRVLTQSYVSWCGAQFDRTPEARQNYLEKVKYKSYFIWLQKAVQQLYGLDAPITAANWDDISQKIAAAYQNDGWSPDGHSLRLLKDNCLYEKIILDPYWNPGSNNGHPELFTPTFRINMFLFGYSKEAKDHNGNNPWRFCDEDISGLDEYIALIRSKIEAKKAAGCVALKSALAYDRELDFTAVSHERAQKAFGKTGYVVTAEDIKAFQDYVFFEICKIAAELDLPFQNHTGLGLLRKTNAMQLHEVIAKNPDTKFVLFHGSYPWTEDICALLHNYENVYPDLCWLPIISPMAAEQLLHQLVEIGISDRVCWGCDTWTGEESYGALLAMRQVLAAVLSHKVATQYLSREDAKTVIDNILYHNPKRLYLL